MRSWLRRHWRWALPAGVVLAAFGAWLVFGFFAFQTYFQDDEVDEALPFFTAGPAPSGMAGDETTQELADAMNEAMADDNMPMIQEVAEPMPEMPAAQPEPEVAASGDEVPGDSDSTEGASVLDSGSESEPESEAATPEPASSEPVEPVEPSEPVAVENEPAVTEPAVTEPVVTEPPQPQIIVEASGSFIDRSHPTEGSAQVLGDGSGQRFLRFEDFRTDNGPDLNVYLSTAPPDASAGQFDDDFIDLGDLKGNVGSQNYEIPIDVDLDHYSTVAIWCVRFGVVFGVADLT